MSLVDSPWIVIETNIMRDCFVLTLDFWISVLISVKHKFG